MRGLDPRIHPSSRESSKKMDGRVKPGHDEGKNFVNAMFTTFMRARFTNAFDVIVGNCRRACVWRAGITVNSLAT
ncbi:hypothetical protein [Bradyrhizobium sp.]|jgi:hypothetical protein|uniref:hypothetical protein n=1 Tax=Bradyrhizobium sp. TaxID=376 RepID=UPI002DF884FA|nr:hypothetical protein [Bradyrhizobium sp.]